MSTIEKALGLLEYFSSQTPEIGLSDFKRLTAFDKGTTHRYLTALKDCGFLEQNPTTKAYRLGPAVIRLSAVREKTVPLGSTVTQCVKEMAAELHELVHAALPQANGMSMLCVTDGGNSGTRVAFDEAEILPYHATASGIAMLTFGPSDLRDSVLSKDLSSFTKSTPVTAEKVIEQIETTRREGYAKTDQSFEDDVCSVAVPFFDVNGDATGTVAIATPAARMTEEVQHKFARRLMTTVTGLTESLGGKLPPEVSKIWAV